MIDCILQKKQKKEEADEKLLHFNIGEGNQ